MKSKRTKACEFSQKARQQVYDRDVGCIFCERGYHMEEANTYDLQIDGIMHYIPRSQGGLGIPQNAALGCRYHHRMLDNGSRGRREEMLKIFREYLKKIYPDWNEERLIYQKGEQNVYRKE